MEGQQQALLPLHRSHTLLPDRLPPRGAPSSAPAPSSHPTSLLRVTSLPVTRRLFAKWFSTQIMNVTDPKKLYKWLKNHVAPSRPARRPPVLLPLLEVERAPADIQTFFNALIRSFTARGVVVVIGTLLLIHIRAGARARPEEEEEEALLARGRLPRFVRRRLRDMTHPLGLPPLPPMVVPHKRASDFKEIVSMLRQIKDKAHKDGLKKTEQAITSVATEIQSLVQDTKTSSQKGSGQPFHRFLTKASKECEGSFKTENTKFEATHDKFCKEKAAHVPNFKDCNNTVSLKRTEQLMHCLTALDISGRKEKATLSELEITVADDKAGASLKKEKQGDKSISMIRKSFASVLGPDDKY